MPGSAGGSTVCLSQHGDIFMVISPWPRQIGLAAASMNFQDWLHQVWAGQYWCPLPLPRLEISALLWLMLTCLKALSFSCCVCKLALKIEPGRRFRSTLPMDSFIWSPEIYTPLQRCLPAVLCMAAAKMAYKTDLHMGMFTSRLAETAPTFSPVSQVLKGSVWSYWFWLTFT